MQKTDSSKIAKNVRRQAVASTTLNRRYVKRPMKSSDVAVSVKKSSQIKHFNPLMTSNGTKNMKNEQVNEKATPHPVQKIANERMRVRNSNIKNNSNMVSSMTAQQLKENAIKKALASASMSSQFEDEQKMQEKSKKGFGMHFSFGRVMLALGCTIVAVFAIVYFVNLNMPDISLRVAAMQTGIEASYPSYVPRDYALSDIMSEDGKVTLNFRNSGTDDSFTIVEEKSSWDSNALLNNYVKDEFSNNYATIKEQGLTIYIDESKATWVNGGVVYKLTANNNTLTKKQIKSIATSL